jgi:hypothetical protein
VTRRSVLAFACLIPLASIVGDALADGASDSSPTEPQACSPLAFPETPRVWSTSFTTTTRGQPERSVRANIFTRHNERGRRVMVTRITHPEDLKGSRLFMLERDGDTEILLQTSEQERPKRITGTGTSLRVLGTDFSYEDFERLYGLNRPGEIRKLEDSRLGERPVRVLGITPAGGPDASAYAEIKAFVDRETCIPLRMEFYAHGGSLRKLLTIDPRELQRDGTHYVAHRIRMQDLRDGSATRLIVLRQQAAESFPEIPELPPRGEEAE